MYGTQYTVLKRNWQAVFLSKSIKLTKNNIWLLFIHSKKLQKIQKNREKKTCKRNYNHATCIKQHKR